VDSFRAAGAGCRRATSTGVPQLDTVNVLANFLGFSVAKLRWLADCRSCERNLQVESLRNYRYQFVAKPAGGVRCIEAPKPPLKMVQRHVLRELVQCDLSSFYNSVTAAPPSTGRPDVTDACISCGTIPRCLVLPIILLRW
jgi:hypothetical protein